MLRWTAVIGVAWLWCMRVAAQPITDNDYSLDVYNGPVMGSARMVGLGGAYTAIATGIDGSAVNPAGYAERAESEIDWYEWELGGGLWLGGLFLDNDYDNNGSRGVAYANALQLEGGLRLQFANTGGGLSLRLRSFNLVDQDTGELRARVDQLMVRHGIGYALRDFTVGVGVLLGIFNVDNAGDDAELVSLTGVGAEVGALWRPEGERYRVGLAYRTRLKQCLYSNCAPEPAPDALEPNAPVDGGPAQVSGLIVPRAVVFPWELRAGVAYQFGERRSNPRWRNTTSRKRVLKQRIERGTYEPPPTLWGPDYPPLPDDPKQALRVALENDREFRRRWRHAQPRRYVLVAADAVLIGDNGDGQGLEAFLTQRSQPSGRKYSAVFHLGVEAEVVSDLLRVRAGGYLEPSRFDGVPYRPHFTCGGDVHAFDLWDWSFRGSATIDVAPRYFDWGLSVGFWY